MGKFIVQWTERKKAIVDAKNEEEAEQKAYDLPDIVVHQESEGLIIQRVNRKKLKKVI